MKKITVHGVGGVKLSSDAEFDKWLSKKGVECLLDHDGDEVVGFASLVDGGTYTLGPQPSLQLLNSRPPLSPASQIQSQQQMDAIFARLALGPRKARCQMWTGDRTVYKLSATNFREFDDAVRAKYSDLDDEQTISYYVIKQKNDVGSRSYISNDDDLNDFFDLAGKPTIYIWSRDVEASLSPASLPSEVEIQVSSAESISVTSSSSRSHNQKLFRQSVRKRDGHQCVLSGETLKEKTGNLEAAHIFGIESSLSEYREAARVYNAYDTSNGMLLEKSLQVAFDAFQWCMDEDLVVHVSEEGKKDVNIQQWEGKRVRLSLGSPLFPYKEHIRARFALYSEKQKKGKNTRKSVRS